MRVSSKVTSQLDIVEAIDAGSKGGGNTNGAGSNAKWIRHHEVLKGMYMQVNATLEPTLGCE